MQALAIYRFILSHWYGTIMVFMRAVASNILRSIYILQTFILISKKILF